MRRFAGSVKVSSSYRAQAALLHTNLVSLRGLLHDPAPPLGPSSAYPFAHALQPSPGFIVVLRLFCRRLV